MATPTHGETLVQTSRNLTTIKALTFVMFMMFAMTTESVGNIIPEITKQFSLSATKASAFQYATMGAIALAGFFLGFLADRIGRKATIIIGLLFFAADSYLFVAGHTFAFFVVLLAISGASIGVFKTGALALIGDISRSTSEHTKVMNLTEGFFGVGSIIGPALVTKMIASGVGWQWLYVTAGSMCLLLVFMALMVKYPESARSTAEPMNLGHTISMLKSPYALGFSLGEFLYVSAECAIYVWMPTYLAEVTGAGRVTAWLIAYSLSIFFLLRCSGRFLGVWVLEHFSWTAALSILSAGIFVCFAGTMIGGPKTAVFLLPCSGLFMSMIYPTLNSKGISCFKKSEHGAVSGVLLFFTCAGAAVSPLAMGAASDALGGMKYGFMLAAIFAGLLFAVCLLNWIFNPARKRLEMLDETQYEHTTAQ